LSPRDKQATTSKLEGTGDPIVENRNIQSTGNSPRDLLIAETPATTTAPSNLRSRKSPTRSSFRGMATSKTGEKNSKIPDDKTENNEPEKLRGSSSTRQIKLRSRNDYQDTDLDEEENICVNSTESINCKNIRHRKLTNSLSGTSSTTNTGTLNTTNSNTNSNNNIRPSGAKANCATNIKSRISPSSSPVSSSSNSFVEVPLYSSSSPVKTSRSRREILDGPTDISDNNKASPQLLCFPSTDNQEQSEITPAEFKSNDSITGNQYSNRDLIFNLSLSTSDRTDAIQQFHSIPRVNMRSGPSTEILGRRGIKSTPVIKRVRSRKDRKVPEEKD